MTIKLRFFYRQQFLQAVVILLYLIVLINFTSGASVAQEKTTSNKNSMPEINIVLITGLLALVGTVIGGVVKGYWDVRLADKDLQSKLILRALEQTKLDERLTSLKFLNEINLITDSNIKKGIIYALDSKNQVGIPYFKPVNPFPLQATPGVSLVPSAKASIIEKNPELKENTIALVALKVRHGNVIDSITPIFAEITPNLEIGNKIVVEQIGGEGGGETLLEKEGYIITAIQIQKGAYFGRDEVIHLQAIWQKLTPQGIDSVEVESEKLGSGNYAVISKPLEKKLVEPGNYISDFQSKLSYHTSGETFLNDIEIEQKKLPIGSMRA